MVPETTVTAKNGATRFTSIAMAEVEGSYVVLNLIVRPCSVTFEGAGVETAILDGGVVHVTHRTTLGVQLAVNKGTHSVTLSQK